MFSTKAGIAAWIAATGGLGLAQILGSLLNDRDHQHDTDHLGNAVALTAIGCLILSILGLIGLVVLAIMGWSS